MNVPCDLLLHPELLTNEQLKDIIQQRHLKIPYIEQMQRDDLLDLFHQFCVPYGQRRYRDSGRGKILNKTRQMSPERPPKFNTINTIESRKLSRTWSSDRIKPPPDLLSGHMKRIKLENKSPTVNKDVNNIKRKMSVDGDTLINESPPPKKDKKPITWP
ncbi:ashwin-like [Pectinophora gossypiella]|uniref:Ashwin n=1 Tax=Pectinophora gossypiella TaxID=13191 RepID=A0A1E1WFH0_PECGO|nr:ashwin-like [Pectinophora gossypiella]